jgi:Alpha amylase, catalytic domain
VRIIFLDTELSNWAWDPISKSYYWHRFFSYQPDLNFDNPAVLEAMWEVMKFWLNLGVDGLRLTRFPIWWNGRELPVRTCRRRSAINGEFRKRLDASS